MLSPEEYITKLGLDEDQLDDIQDEIDTARNAWKDVVGEAEQVGIDSQAELLTKLVSGLGTTYDEETHGLELSALAQSNDGLITKGSFVDWYVCWIFKSDGDEFSDDGNGSNDDQDEANKGTAITGKKAWTATSWSVAPTAKEEAGVTWKCKSCRIINQWASAKCLACDTTAPHADTLPKPEASTPAASFGGSTGFTAPAGSGTSSSGFVFGGAAPAGATAPTGLFTFGGAPAAPVTAPVSTGGFAAPVSGGFTFGSATVPAATPK